MLFNDDILLIYCKLNAYYYKCNTVVTIFSCVIATCNFKDDPHTFSVRNVFVKFPE